ncbi:MAG: hypothetical protein EBX51_08040, partial [Acidimicrobiia bacterium]|nr:hypothetical protein [Acidimicrobiia bacterium]
TILRPNRSPNPPHASKSPAKTSAYETNTASRRAAERAGFELAGTSGDQCPDGDCQVVGLEYRRTI